MKSIIQIDWDEVTAQLESGDFTLRDRLRDDWEKMRKVVSGYWNKRQAKLAAEHVQAMMKLKPQTKVYYISNYPDFVGRSGFKVRNAKNGKMVVAIIRKGDTDAKVWYIPYQNVSDVPLSEEVLKNRKIEARIGEHLQNTGVKLNIAP